MFQLKHKKETEFYHIYVGCILRDISWKYQK